MWSWEQRPLEERLCEQQPWEQQAKEEQLQKQQPWKHYLLLQHHWSNRHGSNRHGNSNNGAAGLGKVTWRSSKTMQYSIFSFCSYTYFASVGSCRCSVESCRCLEKVVGPHSSQASQPEPPFPSRLPLHGVRSLGGKRQGEQGCS
jgi:hypothetical protein